MLASLYLILVSIASVSYALDVQFPLDEQLPQIARINEPYLWSFSPDTFGGATNGEIRYSAQSLPSWLSFDPDTLTFSGQPKPEDEGAPQIRVVAHDGDDSASSSTSICVTHYAPPTLHRPISDQLRADNPSLSSVFLLSNNSAIHTTNPALRVPSGWSFSIGFEGDTYVSENSLFYGALLANGSALPAWITFRPDEITFDGVAPRRFNTTETMSIVLHASDQKGYSAASSIFDLVIASHELSVDTASLPTINVTASTPFSIVLSSPADFTGVLIDGLPLSAENISSLDVDVSQFSDWLKYDEGSRTLSGNPPKDIPESSQLPVVLQTTFNQTIDTHLSLAPVPSYFTADSLPSINAPNDGKIDFDLQWYFSNATKASGNDVNLTASFEPPQAASFSSFNSSSGHLSMSIPSQYDASHISIIFTAYSRLTHSTSHTTLPIAISWGAQKADAHGGGDGGGGDHGGPGNVLSAAAHKRLALGLEIGFGILGGLFAFAALLAILRRCARVEDTALAGEEGRSFWSDKDRKWYGIREKGLNGSQADSPLHNPFSPDGETPGRTHPAYATYGLGLSRLPTHNGSPRLSPGSRSTFQSSGFMSKREFLSKVRETVRTVSDTVRHVSDKYHRPSVAPRPQHPFIGKPILINSSRNDVGAHISMTSNPFEVPQLPVLVETDSGVSAPIRSPQQVHFSNGKASVSRQSSISSSMSDLNDLPEAVVQTASRAMSVRSGKSESGISLGRTARPRLVPFTSATRVPVPSSMDSADRLFGSLSSEGGRRVTSHKAELYKTGADQSVRTTPSTLTVSTNMRSSFSSLESSHQGHGSGGPPRMLVRTGERFKFKVPVQMTNNATTTTGRATRLTAKMVNGQPMPKFLHMDLDSSRHNGNVEFYGSPITLNIGVYDVGIFRGAERVGQVVIDVVSSRS
ncbi:hypothetical protein FISHEDRAFT_67257 [Fistulina hepatica ATCC 64428]|uniref:Dystroglycan-type cadherin-like domain-containing protein n=1 Tax=Fistulina hepatica ATCC 64428 TaxID=1128425 RepID=A0A0D7A1W6_9AGAR|nr:hypothetical protein FISHEDRAFT_67257 [Fistulina hepatica ATCC 64428]